MAVGWHPHEPPDSQTRQNPEPTSTDPKENTVADTDQINALAERLVNGVFAEHGTSATRGQLLDAMASAPEVEALTGREMSLLIEKVHDLAHSARLNAELS